MTERRLALKVDCDTFEGSQTGIPNLLDLFEQYGVRATFFFTLGPDTSGRAIFRVFTQKGFLRKMLRSNAASMYGPKTMMYGTLLPPPMIGKKLAPAMKSVHEAGQEVGVHGWDHIRWHDRLGKMSRAQIEKDYGAARAQFAEIFGFEAHSSAAPGWHATADSLRVQEQFKLLYASDTRGGSPCFLEADGEKFSTLEIPSTLPTWDETLGLPNLRYEKSMINYYCDLVRGTEVHSIHTEVEGSAHKERFEKQLYAWKSEGVKFISLEDLAREKLADRPKIPVRKLIRTTIPNRGGKVSATE